MKTHRHQRFMQIDNDDSIELMEALSNMFGSAAGFSLKVLSVVFPMEAILTEVMGENYAKASIPRYRPFFYSEAISPLSNGDKLSPVGLKWFLAQRPTDNFLEQWRPDESRSLSSIFLCAECHPSQNPCMNGGVCNAKQRCSCSTFFVGSMCEETLSCHEMGYCFNNGTCETWKEFCTCPNQYFGSLCQYEHFGTLDYTVDV